ncbi:MAG: response regulator [Gammaproteobacteria bacterium]|nr:response regulator [Gammaproteobacteria bacterium]
MKLLVVDDHANNRMVLRWSLEAEGCQVLEAANGVEALAVLAQGPVDAVITDILMPRMDGFRLCHEIRSSTTLNSAMPVIFYTGTYNSAADEELARAVDADGYLLKPASTTEILAAVHRAQAADRQPRSPSPAGDETFNVLELYSAALVRKLETRNLELEDALRKLQNAHAEIVQLNETLEARVVDRTAALAAANKELESFSFSISHDLRAPLRQINGFAAMLQDAAGAQLDGEGLRMLAQITGAAQRMDELIRALLEFSRSGRAELVMAAVPLGRLLDETLTILAADLKGRDIEWRRAELPRVWGDAMLLRQVLVNLVSNAIKYTGKTARAVIEIGTGAGAAGEALIFVRDNGVGFDPRYASRLFGVFQRLHRAEDFEGTGIGLANAQRIVSRHGGRIWAESAPGEGATFYVALPLAMAVLDK